jgi:hypothetical protein
MSFRPETSNLTMPLEHFHKGNAITPVPYIID